jgi:hypothetical protein
MEPVQPPTGTASNNATSSAMYIADQPGSHVNPLEAWFYTSFCIIFVLLLIIIAMIAFICLKRRRGRLEMIKSISSAEVFDDKKVVHSQTTEGDTTAVHAVSSDYVDVVVGHTQYASCSNNVDIHVYQSIDAACGESDGVEQQPVVPLRKYVADGWAKTTDPVEHTPC